MQVVWKYPLLPGVNKLPLGDHDQVIDVREQAGVPTLWALIEDDRADRSRWVREFLYVGTGQPLSVKSTVKCVPLGVVHLLHGQVVLSVLELVPYGERVAV